MTLLVGLVLLAALVAWWGARRARGAADFYAAGHRAGAWIVGVAGTAAALSAFTFVGGPGLFVLQGAGALWLILSAPLTGALQCWAVGEPVTAIVRERGETVTIPGLFGHRFGGRAVVVVSALVIAVGCVASLAVQARAAIVLGDNFVGARGTTTAIVVMAATALYVTAGGMRAGLLADAVQGAVMAVVAVVLAVAAVLAAGGPLAAVDTLERSAPRLLGAFGTLTPAAAFGIYLLFCIGTCAQPHYVQKFFFLRSRAQLRSLPAVLTLALAVTLTVWIGVGLGGTALLHQGRIAIDRPDDLAPRTMLLLGPWAVLLAAFGTLAALMSTAASFLNLAAAALAHDLPGAFGRRPRGLAASRVATAAIAVAATAVGLLSPNATVAVLAIIGWGFFTAALLPALTIGLAWRRTTREGVVLAMLAGGAIDLVLEHSRALLPPGAEPGLVGAALGVLVLIACGRKKP